MLFYCSDQLRDCCAVLNSGKCLIFEGFVTVCGLWYDVSYSGIES